MDYQTQKMKRFGAWSLMLLFTCLFPLLSVHATTVTAANDTPTTLQTSQAANHTITITTAENVAEGETLTLNFETDFDTSSLTENDVDIADDSADLTTASDCSSTEEASVGIAGDTITFTICAGDGGAIASGSSVEVQIGTNATASGTGSNQIVNPSGAGTYYIGIAGTSGNDGSIALPIGADDGIDVTASVPSGLGAGGGAGTGAPVQGQSFDTTPPIISNVVVSSVTTNSADISWDTNENADGKVDYGETASFEIGTRTNSNLTTHRTISLTGLSEGQQYQFQVRSSDHSGNEATDGPYSFTTLDLTPPTISNINVVDITETSARIIWATDEPATTELEYGTTGIYGTTETGAGFTGDHSVLLTGLTHSTTYHFLVRSGDPSGNTAESGGHTFSTLTNLPPANVTGLTVESGDGQNQIAWTNPPDADLAGVRVVSCTDEFPSGPADPDCQIVFDDLAESFFHTGLVNETTYYYGVFAYDTQGQFASGALGSGTPRAPEEELPPEEEPAEEPPAEEVPPSEEPPTEEPSPGVPPEEGAPGISPVCGNGVCETGEDSVSCPVDCPVGIILPDLRELIELFVSNGTIELTPTVSGTVRLLNNRSMHVQVLARGLSKPVSRVMLNFAGDTFLLSPNFSPEAAGELSAASFGDDAYVASVMTPATPSSYNLEVVVDYADGTTQSESYTAIVEGHGYVYSSIGGTSERISGARVTLHQDGDTVWDGSPFGQNNPITTGSQGMFAWYVPNGSYVVEAEKSGFEITRTDALTISDNIVNPVLGMVPVPPPEEELPVRETVIGVARNVLSTTQASLNRVRSNPTVQRATEVSVPTLAVVAAGSGLTLAVAFDLIPFLQYLFTAPILFFRRRRRKGFGVVYNAVTREPVDLAIVRLFEVAGENGQQKRLVQSEVTGKKGRYSFLAQPGTYKIEVTKDGFSFPTEYLADTKDDGEYLDVYHGEVIEVTDENVTITANVPLDPAKEAQEPSKIIWERRLRTLQQIVGLSGVVAAVVIAILRPHVITYAMIGVQAAVYLLARRLAKPRKPKNWGIVYDAETGRPLSNVVARIFEPEYNKLLDTAVTDDAGRYTFLLGPDQYYAVFEKKGYQPVEVRPIDYTEKEGTNEFSTDVTLEKRRKQEEVTSPEHDAPTTPSSKERQE